MKKFIALTLSAVLAVSMMTGCSDTASKDTTSENITLKDGLNETFNSTSMTTLSGETVNVSESDRVEYSTTTGFAYVVPEAFDKVTNQSCLDPYDYSPEGYVFYFMPEADVANLTEITNSEDADDDEISAAYDQAYANEFVLFEIYRVNPDEEDTVTDQEVFEDGMENVEELGTIGDNTFYFACNSTLPTEGFSDTDLANLQIMIDALDEVKGNIMLFSPNAVSADLTSFSAEDMDGNAVDESIFADYDVTMVNVWATWCQYCVEEMPYLESLYESMEPNVNFITICDDAADEYDTAVSELEQVGATFTTLQGNDELTEKVTNNITGYPTTFFVNSKGEIVGDTQVGAPSGDEDEVIATYSELLQAAVEEVQ